MSKIAILVTSHILDIKQFSCIKKCLNSLLEQTYKSDILFSLSYSNKEIKDKFNEKIKTKYQSIFYYEFDEKKSEFEHYYNLTNYIDKYDYITMCDANDFYENERIEVLLNSILKKNKKDNMDYIGVSERNYKQPTTKYFLVGAISYMLKPIVFSTFFYKINKAKLEKYLCYDDCYTLFSNYLQIILWKTKKIFYHKVYDNLYNITNFIHLYQTNKKPKKTKKYIKIDYICSIFGRFDFNLCKFLKYYDIKMNNIHEFISLKDYSILKNLIIQFCFIKF